LLERGKERKDDHDQPEQSNRLIEALFAGLNWVPSLVVVVEPGAR
jgi:hypothetical protein